MTLLRCQCTQNGRRGTVPRRGSWRNPLVSLFFLAFSLIPAPTLAQGVDCARLQAQLAALDQTGSGGSDRFTRAAQQQRVEIDRTVGYARSLGCDRQQFLFFGDAPPSQCPALNARIQQMQANLGQLQRSGPAGQRQDLLSRYNTYCRGGMQVAVQPRQRGFFEQLFGGPGEPAPQQPAFPPDEMPPEETQNAHGGSQMVCVRSCDGGFFPLNTSRHGNSEAGELCRALCPNVDASVYSRSPSQDIASAVSLDGTPYSDLPNALKFQKSFDPACTCKPPHRSWAEALSDAERVLGRERKGDILVTPEKAAELSRPKLDAKTRAKIIADQKANPIGKPENDRESLDAVRGIQGSAKLPPASKDSAGMATGNESASGQGETTEIIGPDGVKRRVRKVGPIL